MAGQGRRHDLDTLRIAAFALLILYHVGMFYVSWPWHAKSVHAPVTGLEMPMRLIRAWRLPLLFLISGVALRFAFDKAREGFVRRRTWRLLLPLLFGMLVVNAPQSWVELRDFGVPTGSVGAFYGHYLMPLRPGEWPMITPTWNHLWYVLYILVYTLMICGLSLATGGTSERALDRAAARFGPLAMLLGVPVVLLVLTWALRDSLGAQQTLYGDWHNLFVSGFYVLLGYAVAKSEPFWERVERVLPIALVMAGGLSVAMIRWSGSEAEGLETLTQSFVRVSQGWFVVLVILGVSRRLFGRASPLKSYLTRAIFPVYVVHQTLLLMAGWWLTGLGLPLGFEFSLVLAVTLLGSLGIAHIALRHGGRLGRVIGA